MARTRELQDLQADAYLRADMVGAQDRHVPADVARYLNQGGAELWDILIAARGKEWARKDPAYSFTTTADTTSYTMPTGFYLLISARLDGVYGAPLVPFETQEEPSFRRPGIVRMLPEFYEIRRGSTGTSKLEVLPKHQPGQTIVVDYVPSYVDMVNPTDTFDGINGWEEFLVCFAAYCMGVRDDQPALIAAMTNDMARIKGRIQALAPKRDMHRARRVKDVRGPRTGLGGRRYW